MTDPVHVCEWRAELAELLPRMDADAHTIGELARHNAQLTHRVHELEAAGLQLAADTSVESATKDAEIERLRAVVDEVDLLRTAAAAIGQPAWLPWPALDIALDAWRRSRREREKSQEVPGPPSSV